MIKLYWLQNKLYTGKFDYNRPAIPDAGAIDAETNNYLNTLFKNVQSAPITYLRFRADGTYSSVLKGDFEKYKSEISQLKKKVRHGKWWVLDNKYLCYGFNFDEPNISDRFAFCQMTESSNDIFYKQSKGIASHSTHGFTMNHTPDKFIPLNEFSFLEIFE